MSSLRDYDVMPNGNGHKDRHASLHAAGHPFSSPSAHQRHFAFLLCGHHTECILTAYSTHIFIMVTQTDKLGSVVHAAADGPLSPLAEEPSFTVQIVLGARPSPSTSQTSSPLSLLPSLYMLLARQLIAAVHDSARGDKALVLCCALKPDCLRDAAAHSSQSLDAASLLVARTIQQQLMQNAVW